ncbi:RNA polymerase sigma factor [Echinicola sp. 20G]|uniref:RNA polymerase sigma factor n=1 Tax=Echinicola sp. 20G TaxID=2781961 RepID=UPI001910FA10|nr:RNA polymerase sigma-70 factor [Echinicola sp. 20G]
MQQPDPITVEKEDAYLVRKIKQHDELAYYRLYQKYSSKIYRISRKMDLSHHDAEEIVQDVFLHIWKSRERLDESLSINAYIFTIVKTGVLKKYKKRARFVAYQQYAIPMSQEFSTNTEDKVIFEDLHDFATEAINNLPVKQKEVFVMKNIQHMTAEEIASQLNLSVRTVENQIYRATKSLRKKIETSQGVSYSLVTVLLGLLN